MVAVPTSLVRSLPARFVHPMTWKPVVEELAGTWPPTTLLPNPEALKANVVVRVVVVLVAKAGAEAGAAARPGPPASASPAQSATTATVRTERCFMKRLPSPVDTALTKGGRPGHVGEEGFTLRLRCLGSQTRSRASRWRPLRGRELDEVMRTVHVGLGPVSFED